MLILERNGLVLLAERAGTGYSDGLLNLPSGKVDEGEDVISAAIREAWEEVGVRVEREAVRIVHVMHYRNPEGEVRVGWFLAASEWAGEPYNAEPHKCAGISWQPINDLPENAQPYNAAGITRYLKGEPFSVVGW
ncbi:NUDIX domain-containing protein [Kitasatospora sp. NPDC058218]|uniref:NUDIX hydrolase n=1 Tax=Kitasatospora sp. NPDC058218 TaxID=3346385 RepID=UPI0036D94DAB